MTTVLYPGSFDPITNGHLDIAQRASRIFDRVVIGVYSRPAKNLLFTVEERVNLIKGALTGLTNVEVASFSELTVDFARRIGAKVMVRGLRMSADFELEFDMAMMNRRLAPELEVVCLMARQEYQFLSSSLLKEVASLGGDIHSLVPANVAEALEKRFRRKQD